MTMLADVIFPSSYDELAGMGSAELRVLVGKLPNGAELHPKIASMGYHMSKAQRVEFIGYHYYGVGSAESAAKALSAAEVKYAEHQAKKGKKSGPAVPKAKGGVATNCAATAGKALGELAQKVPIDTKLAADLDAWAKSAAELNLAPTPTTMKNLWKQVSDASALPDATGPALDNIMDLGDVLDSWEGLLKAADSDNLADAWLTAQQLAENANKVQGLAPELATSAHQAAAKASTIAAQKAIDKVGFDVLLIDADSPAIDALKALQKIADADLTKLPVPTAKGLGEAAKEAIDNLTNKPATETLDLLGTGDADGLVAKLAKTYEKAAASVPPKYADEVAEALPSYYTQKLATTIGTNKSVLAKQTAEAAADAADEAVQASIAAMNAAKLSKAQLKKIGPQAFKDAGIDTPSLAHYMTKDELIEALAKLEHDQPIDSLLDIAQAKKAAHKSGGTAAQKATKAADPGDIDALKAAPDTADVTSLTEPELKAKAKATKKAKPTTPAEIEDSVSPELSPHPDVLGLPQSKYPKPPQTSHTWSPAAKQPNLGGAHTKHVYNDEDGNVWMWKKADSKGVAQGEVLAHDLGWDVGLDMADIRYADGWQVPGKGKYPHGTVQKFHQGVKGDMTKVPLSSFTDEQLAELQEHQVFDWLISQHDTHSENILVMADGHLVPIDKGQAFKFFGNDRLEVGYSPPGNFGRPVYYDLWDEYAAGRIDLDLDAIDNILARIETLDEAEFRAKVAKYVDQRVTDGGRSLSFLPANLRSADALTDAILERKRNIRSDFTEFYKAQAKRRGQSWTPAWEKRLKAAAPDLVEEAGETAVAAGITTPVTQTFADAVAKKGTGGRALHLAGKDVHQGQALVYVEKGVDGKDILRFELRLEMEADDRLTETLKGITGDLGTGNAKTGGTGYLPDNEWSTVEKFAKTVGAHASDGAYNANTVAEAQKLLGQIDTLKTKQLDKATDLLAKGDTDGWAAAQAQAEKLDTYKAHLEAIDKAMKDGVPPPYKADAFDVTKATNGWKAKAPEAPVQVTEEAGPDLFKSLAVDRDRFNVMQPTDDYLGWQRTGAQQDVIVSSHHHGSPLPGPAPHQGGGRFRGTMEVDGTDIEVSFRSYQQTAATPRKGLLDAEIADWSGDPADIDKLLTMLDRMGIDAKLATAEDEALTYWRVLTGSMKNSVEYSTGQGSGAYGKVRSTIDAIETKVAKAGNLTPKQEAAIYRDAWTETFGEEAVARAPERIIHQRDIFGDETGYGYVHRFDLPEDMRPYWSNQGGYIHGTKHLTGTDVVDRPAIASTNDLVRHGSINFGDTTSASADLYTGGADGTFTSPGWSYYANNRDFAIIRPASADLRVGTYGFSGDRFGAMTQREAGHYLDITGQTIRRSVGSGEQVVRGGASFGEDVEAIVFRSKAKQKQAIKALKDQGVTEIRGLPVEERILYAKYDAEAQELVRKITTERADSLFKPYADVGASPRTVEPTLPKKAPKTKAKAKNAPPPEPDVPVATSAPTSGGPDFGQVTSPGEDYQALKALADEQSTTFDKVTAIIDAPYSTAGEGSSKAISEVLGYGNTDDAVEAMVTDWLSDPNMKGVPFDTYAKTKALIKDKAGGATDAAEAAASVLKTGDEITGLLKATPGQKVAESTTDKTFNYAIPGVKGKLPVQYSNVGGETKVIAQHTDGSWYLVTSTTGKTSKDQLIGWLADMGWPGVAAP